MTVLCSKSQEVQRKIFACSARPPLVEERPGSPKALAIKSYVMRREESE